MSSSCNNCNHFNDTSSTFCVKCNTPLLKIETIVERLKQKQLELEHRHSLEIQSLKEEINTLSRSLQFKTEAKPETIIKPVAPAKPIVEQKLVTPEPIKVKTLEKTIVKPPVYSSPKPVEPKDPSKLELQIQAFLAPIHQLFSFTNKAYNKYKSEGKLPIFFMTITGLIAILFGMGYFMQNSFQYMGIYADLVKVGAGFLSAIIAGGIGFKLYHKHVKFHEFGSSLISLAIIISYLMIYFLSDLGNFAVLSSAILGFTLIVANTAVAIFIAFKYETKIVSVLSLIGGAFAPFYLNATEDSTFYYLYLWLLIAASCFISHKLKWKTLQYLAFSVAMILIEYSVFNDHLHPIIYTGYYHLFAYLFFFVALFKRKTLKEKLEKVDLVILTTNLSFFIINLFCLFEHDLPYLGFILLANAVLVSVPLIKKWKALNKNIKFTFFLVIGTLLGFTIPSLFGQALMGLFWSVEAIGLIMVGFVFAMPGIRKEGYLVLLIALAKLVYSSFIIIEEWDNGLMHEGFLNFVTLGLIISALWFFSKKFQADFTKFETRLFSIFKELTPVWLTSVFMISGYHLIGIWVLNLTIIPMLGLIYWEKVLNTKTSVGIAVSLFGFYLLAFNISANHVNSLRFSQQELFAQIAIIELIVSLWGIQFFFEKIKFKGSKFFPIAHKLRILFFCLIPLLIVYETNKYLPKFLVSGVWVAVLATYFLHKKLKYKALIIEVFVLFIGGIIAPIYIGAFETFGALTVLVVIGIISTLEKTHLEEPLSNNTFKPILVVSPAIVAIITSLIGFLILENFGIFFGCVALQLLVFTYFKNEVAVFNSCRRTHNVFAIILSFFAIAASAIGSPIGVGETAPFIVIINIVVISVFLQNSKNWFILPSDQPRWIATLIFHQLLIISTYTVIMEMVGLDIDGPYYSIALVLHAILLIFRALKKQIKLFNQGAIILFLIVVLKVVLNDIRDFETSEKIVVFILIGILLLGASFLYVKLKDRFDQNHTELNSTKKG